MNVEAGLAKDIIQNNISHLDTHYSPKHYAYYSITVNGNFVWCYSNNAWVSVKVVPDDLICLKSLEKELLIVVEREGREAFRNCLPECDSPYFRKSSLTDAWLSGWRSIAFLSEPYISDSDPR